MVFKSAFTAVNDFHSQILVCNPLIHFGWLVLGNILGFIGYLLLDLVMLISYHLLAIGK